MKNIVVLVFLVIAASSCVTAKKCASKFPPSVITKDSIVIKDTIIYKDRIVEVKIPGDTIRDTIPIPGIPPDINTEPIVLENDYAIAKAWIANSVLKAFLIQKEQVIKFKLDSADRLVKHWESMYHSVSEKQTLVVKVIPGIYKIALWLWIGVIIALVGAFLLKRFKII